MFTRVLWQVCELWGHKYCLNITLFLLLQGSGFAVLYPFLWGRGRDVKRKTLVFGLIICQDIWGKWGHFIFLTFWFKTARNVHLTVVVPKSGIVQSVDLLLIFTDGARRHSITDFVIDCLKNCSNLIPSPKLEGALRKGLLWRNTLDSSEGITRIFQLVFDHPHPYPLDLFALDTHFQRYYCNDFFISIPVTLWLKLASETGQ